MSERSRVVTAACVGAAIGGIWGWLYMTGNGRRLRDRIEPKLDRFRDELAHVQAAGENAKAAIAEGHQLLTAITSVRKSVSAEQES